MQKINLYDRLRFSKTHRPVIFNLVLWVLLYVVMLFLFSENNQPETIDYIYTTCFVIIISFPVTLNFYVLIPFLLNKEKYVIYGLTFIITILGFAWCHDLFFNDIIYSFFPDYFFISYLSNTNIFLVYTIFLVSTTLIKLAEGWFYFNKQKNVLLELKTEQLQNQLSNLKAKINPHFLFNSLNVIYALALESSQTTVEAVLKLSDILRYVIYDADTERISIEKEIQLLKNYIAFQNLNKDYSKQIELVTNIEDDSKTIYPLLLLPLIENSFKYTNLDEPYNNIKIEVLQKDNEFRFYTKNDVSYQPKDEAHSGMGLKTLQSNLELIYPNQHHFSIEKNQNTFEVELILNHV